MELVATVKLPSYAVTALKQFVEAPFEYPTWSPRNGAWREADLRRLDLLRIPRTSEVAGRLADPDSILYGLGRLHELDPDFPGRLANFTAGMDHILLVNVSGSGKTKLVLETLYQNWGLFLTASWHPVVDPYGSDDLAVILRTFDSRGPCHRVPLTKKKSELPPPELSHNRDLLAQEMEVLLLARLTMMDYLSQLASAVRLADDDARVKWFWLQIRPTEIAGTDIFAYVMNDLQSLGRVAIKQRLCHLAYLHKDRLSFVALDEAQMLCQLHPTAFTSGDGLHHRPVLHEILFCLGSYLPDSRLIACGTAVDERVFDGAIQASSSRIPTVRRFCSLGRFWHIEDIRNYLVHFLGVNVSSEMVELAHRYFRGRRRFLAVLVQRTLMHGIPEYVNVLDSILLATTGLRRPGSSGTRRIQVNLGPVVHDSILEHSPFSSQLRCAAYANVTEHQPPVFTETARELVGMAVAHFVDDMDEAQIDEPIILLNLVRWLKGSNAQSTASLIRRRIGDSTTDLRGCAFAESIALYLWRCFGAAGLRLTDLASFPGGAPRWATNTAPFALTLAGEDVRTVDPIKQLDGPLVHAARQSEDVFAWFERSTSPFLVPDIDFGPQLVFVLDTLDGPRLVFVHLEPFAAVRPHRHQQVRPSPPTRYYASKRSARKEFQSVLATFPDKNDTKRGKTFSTLQIYAFAEVLPSVDSRRSPGAAMRMNVVLRDGSPDEDVGGDESPTERLELKASDIGLPIR